jgi:hypothetical protein
MTKKLELMSFQNRVLADCSHTIREQETVVNKERYLP